MYYEFEKRAITVKEMESWEEEISSQVPRENETVLDTESEEPNSECNWLHYYSSRTSNNINQMVKI